MSEIATSRSDQLRSNIPDSDRSQSNIPDSLRIDPYLYWSLSTLWRNAEAISVGHLPFMIERSEKSTIDQISKKYPSWIIPSIYKVKVLPTNRESRYFTARVLFNELSSLVGAMTEGLIVRYQLGAIRNYNQFIKIDTSGFASKYDLLVPIIGIIDDGFGFAHPQFNNINKSLVKYLWNQDGINSNFKGSPWKTPAILGYGAEICEIIIVKNIIAAKNSNPINYEQQTYKQLRYSALTNGSSHGVGMLHAAAGRGKLESNYQGENHHPTILVQLPLAAPKDTSGGWLGYYALDGMRYIMDRAGIIAVAEKGSKQLAINLSFGGNAGPHDGSSMLECAIDELCEDPQIGVFLSAGNNYRKNIHAKRRLVTDKPLEFFIQIPPDKHTDTFVEFWLPEDADTDKVTFDIHCPSKECLISIKSGEIKYQENSDHQVYVAGLFAKKVAQSNTKTMMLLAVRPTRNVAGNTGSVAPAGLWQVTVISTHTQAAGEAYELHAWIERDDVVSGLRRTQQARFVDDGTNYVTQPGGFSHWPNGQIDNFTLSSNTHGKSSFVATSYCQSDNRPAPYAASGPGCLQNVRYSADFAAITDQGVARPGVVLDGAFAGTTKRVSGTSLAAPLSLRWVQNQLIKDPKNFPNFQAMRDEVARCRPSLGPTPTPQLREGVINIDA